MDCSPRQLCTFFLGDLHCGVDASVVQEIVRPQKMTRIPNSPSAIAGLINLRGQIVVAADLRARMGLVSHERTTPMNVVVRARGEVVSLLVDRIGDIVEVPRESFEPPPKTLQEDKRDIIEGAYKLEAGLLLTLRLDILLDPQRLSFIPKMDKALQ